MGHLDITPLLAKYNQFSKITGQELEAVMKQEATLFISNSGKVPGIIQITPPFNQRDNRPGAAFLAAKAAIERDLAAVFKGVSIKGSRTIKKCFGREMLTPVKVPTKERWPDVDAIYKERWKRKNERGQKIMSRGDATKSAKGSRAAPYFVDRSKLEIVRRESIAMIGLACACWLAAARAAGLNPKGIPPWVSRHNGAFGAGTIDVTATSIRITLSSSLPYNEALSIESRMGRVLGYRQSALDRRLPYIIAAAAKKAKLKAA